MAHLAKCAINPAAFQAGGQGGELAALLLPHGRSVPSDPAPCGEVTAAFRSSRRCRLMAHLAKCAINPAAFQAGGQGGELAALLLPHGRSVPSDPAPCGEVTAAFRSSRRWRLMAHLAKCAINPAASQAAGWGVEPAVSARSSLRSAWERPPVPPKAAGKLVSVSLRGGDQDLSLSPPSQRSLEGVWGNLSPQERCPQSDHPSRFCPRW